MRWVRHGEQRERIRRCTSGSPTAFATTQAANPPVACIIAGLHVARLRHRMQLAGRCSRSTGEALRLSKDPRSLYRELAALSCGSWAVIDEVQKVPALLDEVHRLIETHGLRFVLSGSSARKLRQGGVNLLAGRAITTSMFPLVSAELSFEIDPERALRSACCRWWSPPTLRRTIFGRMPKCISFRRSRRRR